MLLVDFKHIHNIYDAIFTAQITYKLKEIKADIVKSMRHTQYRMSGGKCKHLLIIYLAKAA